MWQYNFDENTVISIINKSFQKQFPFLVLFFFTPITWNAQLKSEKKGFISGGEKLADFKTKNPKISPKISINGSTEIRVLEKLFVELFGLIAQVGCSNKEGEFHYTNDKGDKRTLEELSKKLEKAGYMKYPNPYSHNLCDESVDTIDGTVEEDCKVSYNYMHPLL
jgi:hypothetical protein